jgi:hypothetical protein
MRIRDPEWSLVRLAAAQVGCTPQQFVELAVVNLADLLLVGPERSRKAVTLSVRAMLDGPDRFAELRPAADMRGGHVKIDGGSSGPPKPSKRRQVIKPPRRSENWAAGRSPTLKHNPFADLLKDKK